MDMISRFPRLRRLQVTIPTGLLCTMENHALIRQKSVIDAMDNHDLNRIRQKSVIDFFSLYMQSHTFAPLQELEFRFADHKYFTFGSSNSVWVVKLMRLYPTEAGSRNYKIETVRMCDEC